MKQIVPLLAAVFLLACGDNITLVEDDSDERRLICDEGNACDDVLADSLAIWRASGADSDKSYTYETRFASESGLRINTSIDIAFGAPIARRASGVRPDEASGALIPFEWSETGETLGIHSDGARPVPISTLYEECVLEVFAADRAANEVVLEVFASGALKSCTYRALACAGDCTFGPSIRQIEVAAE